jgi:hypothetical protein
MGGQTWQHLLGAFLQLLVDNAPKNVPDIKNIPTEYLKLHKILYCNITLNGSVCQNKYTTTLITKNVIHAKVAIKQIRNQNHIQHS